MNITQLEKRALKIPNLRQIKVKAIPPTSHRGMRVCIYEPKRFYSQSVDRVYLPPNDVNIMYQAIEYLEAKGFNIINRASEHGEYIFLCDNWAEEYVNLKGEKQVL